MSDCGFTEEENEALMDCICKWNQKNINHAMNIINCCENDTEIISFFKECEERLKDPKYCRTIWNNEVFNFSGAEYAYICFFPSKVLDIAIKLSMRIDLNDKIIFVGNINFANEKEKRKLNKHIYNS